MFNLPAGTYKLYICKNGSFAIYNENGKLIHSKYSNGLELWYEYDTNGNQIHHKNSRGFEIWKEYDDNGNCIHAKLPNGLEVWYEYDAKGNCIHYKYSDGDEYWYNADGEYITKEEFDRIHAPCAGKVIEVEGKKYRLTAV